MIFYFFSLLIFIGIFPAFPEAVESRSISLDEVYNAALARSEALARNEALLRESEARVAELWSAVKPRLSLMGSEFLQDSSSSESGFGGTFTRRDRPEAKLNVHQPVFSGLRELAAVRAGGALTDAAALRLERARSLVYQDAASAYFELLDRQEELRTYDRLREVMLERIAELKDRLRLGRARKSELLAAESRLAQLEAQIESGRGAERVAQELLRFWTGLEGSLRPKAVALPELPLESEYLGRARTRPDVKARQRELFSAEMGLVVAKRGFWPTVGLDGNYYLKRVGFQEHIRWDVLVSAELPLYAGGRLAAAVRQSRARLSAAEQDLLLTRRTAEREVLAGFRDLESSLASAKALDRAFILAEANLRSQREDYRLGLVTNLEVLQSLNDLQEVSLNLSRERLRAALARVRLDVAAGGPAGAS